MTQDAYDAIRAEQAQRGEPVAHLTDRATQPYEPPGSRGFTRYLEQMANAEHPAAVSWFANPNDMRAFAACWNAWMDSLAIETKKAS